MSLYHITTELQAILDLADRCGSDEEMAAAVAEHAAALDGALADKADAYAALIRSLEARAEAREAEADRMYNLGKTDAALADRLRTALREAMERTGRTKIETPRFRLSVRANGGKVPVVVEDESALPAIYRVPVYAEKIDKDGVREALERGETVPGARLGERGTRLDLR